MTAGTALRSGRARRLVVTEAGAMVALSLILSYVKIIVLPGGGEISLEMIPLLVFACLRGAGPGMVAGVVYGALHAMQYPVIVTPVQFLLDYPVAYGAVGLAGLFPVRRGRWQVWAGITFGTLARFAVHVVSGVVFIGYFAPHLADMEFAKWMARHVPAIPITPLTFSFIYNASYLLPELLISALLVPPVVRRLSVTEVL